MPTFGTTAQNKPRTYIVGECFTQSGTRHQHLLFNNVTRVFKQNDEVIEVRASSNDYSRFMQPPFGTILNANVENPKVIQELLRHANLKVDHSGKF
jgi:hypothetical protein